MSDPVTRRIHILPRAVADQIAAGEVVERPASVVKELVENSLDAGANRIRVSIEGGGKSLIEVADNGSGMSREDALLSLDRHATSKIQSAADLIGVGTFGFRGEALPSIASVSRLTMLTASSGDAGVGGTEIQVDGGRIGRVGSAARQPGTTITVRGLFFNTPARRKFLRSVSSETRACGEVVIVLALTHPDVGFDLIVDGQSRLSLPPGQDLLTRLAAVWGESIVSTLIPVQWARGGYRITGFIQRPGDAKPTGRRTQLFINGRPFRDNFLIRAAEAGYRSAIHPGDRPSLLVQIAATPEDVDLNVHPAKLEVRFRDRISLEGGLEEAVKEALGTLASANPIGSWDAMIPSPAFPQVATAAWRRPDDGEATDLFDTQSPLEASAGDERAVRSFEAPVLQVFRTYITFETPDGVVIVDQHAAHERVLYEEVMAQLTGSGVPAQRLLMPLTVDLTDEELEVVEQHRESLERVGFDVEPFGGNTIAIHTVPSPHPRFEAELCFREMVSDLARGRFGGWANALERFAATYACRAAVKAGTELSEMEMRALLLRLFAAELPPHDVHGRATLVQLPREELERRFGRR